jgi:hypothetical protein
MGLFEGLTVDSLVALGLVVGLIWFVLWAAGHRQAPSR